MTQVTEGADRATTVRGGIRSPGPAGFFRSGRQPGLEPGGSTIIVRVRYFGGARVTASAPEEDQRAGTLAELLDRIGERHGPAFQIALRACGFLVDGSQWRNHLRPLPPAATVDVLPPFAGG